MKIFDFLFYYLVNWYDWLDPKSKKFKSHKDQAAYVITIIIFLYMLIIDIIVEYWSVVSFSSKIPLYVYVAICLFAYLILRYIYITKGRYDQILKMSDPKFSISEKAGRIIALIIFFFPFPVLVFVALLLHHII